MRHHILSGLILLLTSLQGFTQLSVDDLDLTKITQRKIRDYILMQKEQNVNLLSDFKGSCKNGKTIPGWYCIENTYLIKADADKLWEVYLNTDFAESWEGNMVSFGLLFSRWSDFVCYRNDHHSSAIDTGQVFFINLKVLKGIVNLPVGIEVVEVNDLKRSIVFSYLEGNNAKGKQTIQLFETPEGYTKIIHTANFISDSPYRDKHLYPFFHTKAVNEYHYKMASKLIDSKKEFIISP